MKQGCNVIVQKGSGYFKCSMYSLAVYINNLAIYGNVILSTMKNCLSNYSPKPWSLFFDNFRKIMLMFWSIYSVLGVLNNIFV
jgi:hypothetical protein